MIVRSEEPWAVGDPVDSPYWIDGVLREQESHEDVVWTRYEDDAPKILACVNAIEALAERCNAPLEDVARFVENGAMQFAVKFESGEDGPTCEVVVADAPSAQMVCALGGFVNTGGDRWENPSFEGPSMEISLEAKWKHSQSSTGSDRHNGKSGDSSEQD